MTVYEMYQDAWDRMARNGQPALAEMARHFYRPRDMNLALGYSDAMKNWVKGKNHASPAAEINARRWLDLNIKAEKTPAPAQTCRAAARRGQAVPRRSPARNGGKGREGADHARLRCNGGVM